MLCRSLQAFPSYHIQSYHQVQHCSRHRKYCLMDQQSESICQEIRDDSYSWLLGFASISIHRDLLSTIRPLRCFCPIMSDALDQRPKDIYNIKVPYAFNNFSHWVSWIENNFGLNIGMFLIEWTATRLFHIHFHIFFIQLEFPRFLLIAFRLLISEALLNEVYYPPFSLNVKVRRLQFLFYQVILLQMKNRSQIGSYILIFLRFLAHHPLSQAIDTVVGHHQLNKSLMEVMLTL